MATLAWTEWQLSCGLGGRIPWNTQEAPMQTDGGRPPASQRVLEERVDNGNIRA